MRRRREYLLAVDQGSGSTRALVFDGVGRPVAESRRSLGAKLPRPGWVEHDPEELVRGARAAMAQALGSAPRTPCAMGLTTQRSTVVLWDRKTGRVVTPAVSWQDRRAVDVCRALASRGSWIRRLTGLLLSPHYAAPKIRWLLDHIPDGQRRAEQGDLLCGTVNTFLLWRLSGGRAFVTDHTHAARMLLMSLASLDWDPRLCALFDIPRVMLPDIRPTCAEFGEIGVGKARVPVLASIGDQQAAAIGQGGARGGDLCVNYGTGAFALLFTGDEPVRCAGLLSSIGWSSRDSRTYVLEGGVNAVGSGLEWLTKILGLPRDLAALDELARSAPGSVRVLPAFAGLAAPFWDARAEAIVAGLSLATGRADLVRGFLEGVSFLVGEIVRAAPPRYPFTRVVAGGGLSKLDLLLELQAAFLDHPVERARFAETSAWGAALLAGLGAGVWRSLNHAGPSREKPTVFYPRRFRQEASVRRAGWKLLVRESRKFGNQTGVNQS